MGALLYFAIWALFIVLMMRFGCGAHVMGGRHGDTGRAPGDASDAGLRWIPPERDVDPVCGKTISTSAAKPSVHDGHVYYFCTRDCREIFEASPEAYVGPDSHSGSDLEHSHA